MARSNKAPSGLGEEKDGCNWGLSAGPGSFTDTVIWCQTRGVTHAKEGDRISQSGLKETEERY